MFSLSLCPDLALRRQEVAAHEQRVVVLLEHGAHVARRLVDRDRSLEYVETYRRLVAAAAASDAGESGAAAAAAAPGPPLSFCPARPTSISSRGKARQGDWYRTGN
uniref:Uncharacterized protein n=1 Tax=Pristionchus pacificus TaxID=54126 RepID=A0A2A6BKX4_PRIPA|eukprot:PDM66560.1 hypothetical protein PRIPAC_47977 [Pristionchus pacificus]